MEDATTDEQKEECRESLKSRKETAGLEEDVEDSKLFSRWHTLTLHILLGMPGYPQ